MQKDNVQAAGRGKERVFLLLITILLGLFFVRLYGVLQQRFADVPQRLQGGTIVNLNAPGPAAHLKALLEKGYYFEDKRDVALIEGIVAGRMGSGQKIDNIGELNKRKYEILADDAFARGGASFKKRVMASRSLLGYTGDDSVRFIQEQRHPPALPASVDAAMGEHGITGKIQHEGEAVPGVLVRLDMILPQDSLYTDNPAGEVHITARNSPTLKRTYAPDSSGRSRLQTLTAFARTDAGGSFAFEHLPGGKAYKVLPLQPGYQFGASQGIEGLEDDAAMVFRQSPHTIRLLSARDFNVLKKEKSLIVRTPHQFNQWYIIIVISFFAGFLLVHLLLSWKFKAADQLILPVIMLLTGMSFLTLLSLQDPLRDRFLAKDSLAYLVIGLAGMCALLFFQLRRFTADSGAYRLLVFKQNRSAANGWPWAASAMLLLALTIGFGSGPEGSGVKVNLLGFQPSEIVKYLIILFLAGFFAANERLISEYASWAKRWSFFSFALVAILFTLLLFLLLGDLGPAMVVCFTFIILFSFSRGDFTLMAGAIVIDVLISWLFKNVWLSVLITALMAGGLMLLRRRQLSESAVMALVIMAAFVTIDQVPHLGKIFPGPVQRLTDRKAIWQDAWNNEVYGGDQVANGLWAMSGGGITGQGIGQGYAKTIPEAHTDMILPSMGEEFGWTGIICIFLLFLLYLHRSIIIGRGTGTPFLFYLCAGIGLSTFVQFLLIAGGSTGALPLSGVSLPFQSYGGSSLVANLLASGFLLSASMVRGTPVQLSYLTRQQDKNLVPALLAACMAIALLSINVSRYLFNNKKWVVQPALVADKSGARMFSYNPRIAILMNRLQAGNLYDRSGLILATSRPELIRRQLGKLEAAGLGGYNLDSAEHKRSDRYYPFGEQTFFWTGDANTGVFNGSPNGYFAEYEHAADLRGFRMPAINYNVTASRYKEDRFLPGGVREMTVLKKDYRAVAPLLLAGINSAEVDAFRNRNRNVQLTIDAGLQTRIQKSIAADTALQDNRVSVVVMESNTGDVLASSVYPLPPVHNWEQLTMTAAEQNTLSSWMTTVDLGFTYATQPGSTAKVLTAMAAFNKMGMAAAGQTYPVSAEERIRTKGIEPDETGIITMEQAVVKSNNVYFIKLANQQHLQEDMASLYLKTGMFLHGVGGYYYGRQNLSVEQEDKWRTLWRKTEFNTKPRYDPNNIHKTRAKGISGMAWGQGALIATPAAVARLAAGVANHGMLVPNRYVLKVSDSLLSVKPGIKLTNSPQYARLLKRYMIAQSALKKYTLGIAVAGKTGTPERIWKGQEINDGWYVFFAPKPGNTGNIVVCIRIERTKGSSDAVKLAGQHVIPYLLKEGYIKDIARDADDEQF